MLPRAFLLILLFTSFSAAADTPEITIPRIDHSIGLADFDGMQPRPEIAGKLRVIDEFVQSTPQDGASPSQRSVVYLAYDSDNLYVIFACFDSNRERIA